MSGEGTVNTGPVVAAGRLAAEVGSEAAIDLARLLGTIDERHADFVSRAGKEFRLLADDIGEELIGLLRSLDAMAAAVGAVPAFFGAVEAGSAAAIDRLDTVMTVQAPGAADIVDILVQKVEP